MGMEALQENQVMNSTWTVFKFDPSVAMADVEATLRLATVAAEGLHGEDRIRQEVRTRIEPRLRSCMVDTTADSGRTLATVFGEYVRREFGDQAVEMSKLVTDISIQSEVAG
jgi:hypothetical protein